MTPEQKAAYVFSQAVDALIHLESAKAANRERENQGYALAYGEDEIAGIHDEYCIDHRSVTALFGETND